VTITRGDLTSPGPLQKAVYARLCREPRGRDGIALAAAYRRAAFMLRYYHPRLLDAPTLLARADEVIE
jgi:hypothetical protein